LKAERGRERYIYIYKGGEGGREDNLCPSKLDVSGLEVIHILSGGGEMFENGQHH
jgi:hypothetical protein